MQYKIIVDKQSRTNPSADKKEYMINIEELRTTGSVSDSLIITKDEAYVLRRLKLTEYHVLEELENPIKQTLADVKIELFEGDNYIYLIDMTGNKFYAEYIIKNDLTDMYATKLELTTAINQTADQIQLLATQKLDKDEFSTELQVNYEAVKIAWNKISDYIQMMIVNNNASFAILDQNKKILMTLDKTGQHFYKSDGTTIFGEMGVNKEDSNSYISFAVDGEYNEDITDGMAWGIKTKSDNKYHPILYIKNFHMGAQNSDDVYGQLALKYCDLILEGMETGIQSGNVRFYGNVFSGITFEDTNGNGLLSIYPYNSSYSGGVTGGGMTILDAIQFFKNALGSNSFKIGTGNKYVLMTDNGVLTVVNGDVLFGTADAPTMFTVHVSSLAQIFGNLSVEGNVYANNISSDRRIKNNIKDCTTSALDIINKIQHKEFDKKDDGKHYKIGYIAQDMEQIDPNFVIKRPEDKDKNIEERYYINELPIIATLTKATQELQKQIEELKQRIENLEKGAKNGNT